MTRRQDAAYTPPSDPYKPMRCPDCKHIRYADENAGDPCRFCGSACPNHSTPIERARRGEGS